MFSADESLCRVCSSKTRDNNLIMIVEKDVDLENIERMNVFNGKYFVLGGLLSLSDNGKSEIRLKQLYDKIQKEKPAEIILATSATVEGENTNLYIKNFGTVEGQNFSSGTRTFHWRRIGIQRQRNHRKCLENRK